MTIRTEDTHVEACTECFRTRVQLPPPPPPFWNSKKVPHSSRARLDLYTILVQIGAETMGCDSLCTAFPSFSFILFSPCSTLRHPADCCRLREKRHSLQYGQSLVHRGPRLAECARRNCRVSLKTVRRERGFECEQSLSSIPAQTKSIADPVPCA